MKRKIMSYASGLLALLLCTVILTGTVLPASAADTSLDYGIYGRENNTEYAGAALYRYLFGSDPTEGEAKYLERLGLTFCYNSAIPSSVVSTDYNGDEGILSITVRPYRYTASNGAEVIWTPVDARVDGDALPLTCEGDVYLGRLEGIFRSEDFDLEVDYSWSVTIPRDTVARLRNEAYLVGADAYEKNAEYEEKLAQYEKRVADYYAWQEYLKSKAAYDAYCEALAHYQQKLAAHEKYLEDKKIYIVRNAAYEQWQAYYEKERIYTADLQKYTNYQNYLSAMEEVKEKLWLMEVLYKCDSRSWAIYYSTMGSTVTSVLERKDELVNTLFCPEDAVDLAGESTEALRVLFRGYDPLRKTPYVNEYRGIAERYTYFHDHYDEFKLHFTNLYTALRRLVDNVNVEQVMDTLGNRKHYLQFVSQLYVISSCFNEDVAIDPSWRLVDFRLQDLLEPVHILEDGDWHPKNSPLPEYVEPAICPTPVNKPTVEQPERKPMEPDYVPHPGNAPAAVSNPDENGIPTKTETYPQNPPTPPTMDSLTALLVGEIRDGKLKKYDGNVEDMTLDFSSTLLRRVSISNMKTVTFYSLDGTVLKTVSVPYGGSVSAPLPPEHAPSPAYTYRPRGWLGADGEEVNFSNVTEDLDVYPHYEMIKKTYSVTWRVTDVEGSVTEHRSSWSYGSLPKPGADVSCKSYDTYGYTYEFSGWDKEIEAVTGDCVYSGSFRMVPKKFPIRWVVGDLVTTELWDYGSIPTYSGNTEIVSSSEKCIFLGFSPEIKAVSGSATYTAIYERHPFAVGGASETLSLNEDSNTVTVTAGNHSSVSVSSVLELAGERQKALVFAWDNGCKLSANAEQLPALANAGCNRVVLESYLENGDAVYSLHLYNERLEEISLENSGVTLQLPYEEFEDGKMTVFFLRDAAGKETRIEQKSISLSAGATVRRAYAYPLKVLHNPLCNTMSIAWDALIGSTVSLNVTCDHGYEITAINVKDANGNNVPLNGYDFVMPESTVDISFTVEPILYHVIFRSEGAVIFEKTYGYGERIEVPANPIKKEDAECSYSFVSWGRKIPAFLSGDERELVFDAQFASTLKNVDYDTSYGINLFTYVLLPAGIALLLFLIVGIPLLVIHRRKRKKRRMKS